MKFGYTESPKKLNNRIKSYKKYSNNEINDWIINFIDRKKNDRVLDIGCGTGKQTVEFSKISKKVLGIDINKDLIEEARNINKRRNIEYMQYDFNNKFDWAESGEYDIVSSCYSIYYADDMNSTIKEMKRILKDNGDLFICGPAKINSLNLYRMHDLYAHSNLTNTAYKRTNRIYNEVIPILAENFEELKIQYFYNTLSFPSVKSFMDYYTSTLLFEENTENKNKVLQDVTEFIDKYINQMGKYEVHKVAIGILAYGKDFRSEF